MHGSAGPGSSPGCRRSGHLVFMIRRHSIRVLVPLLLSAAFAFGQAVQLVDPSKADLPTQGTSTAKPVAQQPLLPASFGNWQRQSQQTGREAARFDAANAAVLKEYGFSDFAVATYAAGSRTLRVRAARFADAGGAFGTFTFLRQPGDQAESLGDEAASTPKSLIFYRSNVLVEVDSGSGAAPVNDLRILAAALPQPNGPARNLPSLPSYLPKQALQSVRYFAGPVAAATSKLPLTLAEVRWDDGAEVVWAQRPLGAQTADLVMISYPTPQMAAARLRDLEAAMVREETPGITRVARRTGPIVVWVSGAMPLADAKSLAASVSYDASITWNEPTFLGKRDNVGNLVVAALALAGVVLLMSLVAGLAFGGLRILMKHFYPDRVFDRSQDVEIIRLHLTE
jgi:hypothetical protein